MVQVSDGAVSAFSQLKAQDLEDMFLSADVEHNGSRTVHEIQAELRRRGRVPLLEMLAHMFKALGVEDDEEYTLQEFLMLLGLLED